MQVGIALFPTQQWEHGTNVGRLLAIMTLAGKATEDHSGLSSADVNETTPSLI